MKQRLLYPDLCKLFAIFMVTWSHCAQFVSEMNWNNLFCGTALDVMFTMPLFFLMSGWFINVNKIREARLWQFVFRKFKRLIIPMVSWYGLLLCVMKPGTSVVSFYWYLSALFACYLIIIIFAKIIKNNILCTILSTLFVLFCPLMDYCHVNFMFPFLCGGVIIRKIFDDKPLLSKWFFSRSLILAIVLIFFWNSDYSVYRCPFEVLHLNWRMTIVYVYRFALGMSVSSVIIYLIKHLQFKPFLSRLSHYGQYTLVIYTASFFFNGIIAFILKAIEWHTNEYLLLDIISLFNCLIIIALTVMLSNFCRKNKVSKLMLLGE